VKILALDTATENCSAALFINGTLLAREELLGRGHAERILPMIQELLAESGVALRELSAVAFGRGPGAFTGVRLAASITQGLAFGAALPVVPVSDLQALAQRVLDEHARITRVLSCTDARMREVYFGAFERGAAGIARAVTEERVSAPAELLLPEAWLAGAPELAGAGSGFAAYPELKARLASRGAQVIAQLWPRAREIACIAAAEAAAGHLRAPGEAIPVYLRDDVARAPQA